MSEQNINECDSGNGLLTDLPLATEQAEQTNAGSGNVTLIGPPAADGLEKVGLGTLILPH